MNGQVLHVSMRRQNCGRTRRLWMSTCTPVTLAAPRVLPWSPRICAIAAGPGAQRRCPLKIWNAWHAWYLAGLEPSPLGGGAPGRAAQRPMGSVEARE